MPLLALIKETSVVDSDEYKAAPEVENALTAECETSRKSAL